MILHGTVPTPTYEMQIGPSVHKRDKIIALWREQRISLATIHRLTGFTTRCIDACCEKAQIDG